ncbi:MAG: hypothetical protein GYB31_16965 [Bacteroidetes bacterium]|nr:hypothetical protein [Bacteroidota bacterium]
MKISKVVVLFFGIFVMACASEVPDGYSELSLMKYGLPVSLMAPDSAEVKTMDMGLIKDVSVKKGEDYFIQITMSEATSMTAEDVIADLKSDEEKRSNFMRLVEEDPKGFIVERSIDSTRNTYDFRYAKIKGDQQFLFQTGLSGFYSLEEVERMYESVQHEGGK